MLTKVILDGKLGKAFGRKWSLNVRTPIDALKMIDANKGGIFKWIRDNLKTYSNYQVTCTYANGVVEKISQHELNMNMDIAEMRFTPIIEGAGGGKGMSIGMMILGVILLVVAIFFPPAAAGYFGIAALSAGAVGMAGVGMALGGIIGMLTPQPKAPVNPSTAVNKTSYYFNGPENTIAQGLPVQLIYGRCMVGSHAIAASLSVNNMIINKDGTVRVTQIL